MDEQQAREDLAVIRRFMEDGRRDVMDRGKHLLVWGSVGMVGSALTYAYVVEWTAVPPGWLWLALMAAGWAGSVVIGRRESRRAPVKTFARRLLSVMWVSSAIVITLIALAGIFSELVDPRALPGLLSVALGAPILVAGVLAGERWLRLVGAGWWFGGGIMLFVPGVYALLLMGAMSLLLMAVPGGVLYAKSRRGGASSGQGAVMEPS